MGLDPLPEPLIPVSPSDRLTTYAVLKQAKKSLPHMIHLTRMQQLMLPTELGYA